MFNIVFGKYGFIMGVGGGVSVKCVIKTNHAVAIVGMLSLNTIIFQQCNCKIKCYTICMS